jgi:cytoskeleton protein RodZ
MADRGLCVGSFGEKLRRERELRAISLQEISTATKIGTRILTALEEDDFDKLPGGIFNKGFVRAYARYVGIDEEKAVADYLEAAKGELHDQEFQVVATQMEAARIRELQASGVNGSASSIKGAVVAIVLLAALAAGYHWRRAIPVGIEKIKVAMKGHKTPTPTSTSSSQPTPAPALPVTAPAPQEPATLTPAQPNAMSTPQNPVTVQTVPAQTVPEKTAPETTKPPVEASSGQADSGVMEKPDRIRLEIQANEKSWVAVTTDGGKTFQTTLDPSNDALQSHSFKAQKRITMITGNPAGLTVTYNGKKLEPWTGPGRRMTVTFTPEGFTVQ